MGKPPIIADRRAGKPDAEMTPWCLVPDGDEIWLFGFAMRHPRTGGLSWALSTSIVTIDLPRGRAITRSGRHYVLGQCVEVPELPTEEARIAFALLVAPRLGIDTAVLLGDLDEELARQWIVACKMSRHLGVPAPERERSELEAFYARHAARYEIVIRARQTS